MMVKAFSVGIVTGLVLGFITTALFGPAFGVLGFLGGLYSGVAYIEGAPKQDEEDTDCKSPDESGAGTDPNPGDSAGPAC